MLQLPEALAQDILNVIGAAHHPKADGATVFTIIQKIQTLPKVPEIETVPEPVNP